MKYFSTILSSIAALAIITGCSTPKNLTYMQDLSDRQAIAAAAAFPLTVQPDDKLSITVNTDNPELSEMLNLATYSHRIGERQYQNSTLGSISQSQSMSFYTVDPKGDIDFPLLGALHIEGMTRDEVAKYITRRLEEAKLAKNPVVIVEFANASVTLAGEVARPGRYNLQRDYTPITEIIGEAGDLTIQGKRENVLVVRQIGNGELMSYRIDLTDGQSLAQSPVYYVRQNDYIYVEPNNMKKRSSTVNGNNVLSASFWVSVASLLTSIAVLVFK